MTDTSQTGWQISIKGTAQETVISGAYIYVWSIAPKALLCAVWPLKSPLVLVFHLRVISVGVSQRRQAAVEAALGKAVHLTIHPLHRVTEGQRVTVLIHIGGAGWPGDKGEESFTWGFTKLRTTHSSGLKKTNTLTFTKNHNVVHDYSSGETKCSKQHQLILCNNQLRWRHSSLTFNKNEAIFKITLFPDTKGIAVSRAWMQSQVKKNVCRRCEPFYSNVVRPYSKQLVHFWITALLFKRDADNLDGKGNHDDVRPSDTRNGSMNSA